VEEGGLAGVVEAEEEDLGLLLPQPQRRQHPVEPVHQEHLCSTLRRSPPLRSRSANASYSPAALSLFPSPAFDGRNISSSFLLACGPRGLGAPF
jgi:hypothetical protein